MCLNAFADDYDPAKERSGVRGALRTAVALGSDASPSPPELPGCKHHCTHSSQIWPLVHTTLSEAGMRGVNAQEAYKMQQQVPEMVGILD
jgi:hypothetical protein